MSWSVFFTTSTRWSYGPIYIYLPGKQLRVVHLSMTRDLTVMNPYNCNIMYFFATSQLLRNTSYINPIIQSIIDSHLRSIALSRETNFIPPTNHKIKEASPASTNWVGQFDLWPRVNPPHLVAIQPLRWWPLSDVLRIYIHVFYSRFWLRISVLWTIPNAPIRRQSVWNISVCLRCCVSGSRQAMKWDFIIENILSQGRCHAYMSKYDG